jgi:hypothetical protein
MKRIYELEWTNKYLTNHATNIDEMQTMLGDAAAFVRELRDFGDKVESDFNQANKDTIYFYTDDPEIAEEYGFSTCPPRPSFSQDP